MQDVADLLPAASVAVMQIFTPFVAIRLGTGHVTERAFG